MANASVDLVIEFKNQWSPVRNINEAALCNHSRFLREELARKPASEDGSPKRLIITGSFGPINMVLTELEKHHFRTRRNDELKISCYRMQLERVAMLWEATEFLQIEPKQEHIRAHIRGWISHQKLSPEELVTLHRVFYPHRHQIEQGERTSVWDVLIHHTAWNAYHGQYTTAEIDNMEAAAVAESQDLANAVEDKMLELDQRQRNFEDSQRGEQARRGGRQARRRAAEHRNERQARQRQELSGEREISEVTARNIMSRPPRFWSAVVSDGRHGRRGAAGSRTGGGAGGAGGNGAGGAGSGAGGSGSGH